jgi:DNA polymerase-3 subunit epsilon
MKKCFIDVETTGLSSTQNGIHQISGIIEIGDKLETFNFHVRPFERDIIVVKALEVSGVTEEDLKTDKYENPRIVYGKFCNLLEKYVDKFDPKDKFLFIAYNAPFDYQFIRQWFTKNGDKYFGSYFVHPPIDVMTLACAAIGSDRFDLINFKLNTVAKYFGIKVEEDKLHDAVYDIQLTQYLYDMIKVEKK